MIADARHWWRPSVAGMAATVVTGATFAVVFSQSVVASDESEPVADVDSDRTAVSAVHTSYQVDDILLDLEAERVASSSLQTRDHLEAAQEEFDTVLKDKEKEAEEEAAEEAAQREQEEEEQAAEEAASPDWVAPSDARITSDYGERWGRMHNGTDFGDAQGASISAAADGEVTFADWNGGFGQLVIIRHDDGTETYYAHASELLVSAGDSVSAGDDIMLAGSTGNSTGPHLHFEVHVGGSPVEPLQFLREQGVDI